MDSHRRGEKPETQRHGQGKAQAVPEAARQQGTYGLGPVPAQSLGGQVHGRDPDPGGAHGVGQACHGENELQKADAGGPHTSGEVDLKACGDQPQGQVGSGEQESSVKHGVSFFQCVHPLALYG